ncbi:MAG: hypothetical protein KDJ27_02510 [Gammaproteobacteria bacterium]|nr:hypothetical protein [Gammaproteobacteria bacterium]MCB1922614.1 hypothetical protein [Gammaproteobacteria bacterium]
MGHELEINGRELMELSEDAPDQVEAILSMMIDADEEIELDNIVDEEE